MSAPGRGPEAPVAAALEGFAISSQQEHLWRLMRAAGGRAAPYLAACSIRIDGPLDRGLLRRALAQLIDRHEILRTSFRRLPGLPLPIQVIAAVAAPPQLPVVTLAKLAAAVPAAPSAWQQALAGASEQLSLLPFDLERGPLLRLLLVELRPDAHELLVSLPALCADAASLRLLAAALELAYEPAGDGARLMPGAAEPLQYVDYCQWQDELLAAPDVAAAQAHWQERGAVALRATGLPGERQPAATAPFAPRELEVAVASELAAALAALAGARGWPLPAVLLAAWEVLLWRVTGEPELAVGVVSDGRRYAELAPALGLFARSLPVAARIREELAFPALVAAAVTALDECRELQDLFAWRDLVDAAGPEPFASFGFEWRDGGAAAGERGAPATRFAPARLGAASDRWLLRLSAGTTAPAGLALALGYDAGRVAPSAARRLAVQLRRLLAAIGQAGGGAVADLPFLAKNERQRLLVETAGPPLIPAAAGCIHRLIAAQVERSPAALAVAAGGERLTYRELDRRAARLAGRLRRLGVGPEVRVGLCAGRTAGLVVGIYGILKAGGAYVPLDPDLPDDRLGAVLRQAQVGLVLCERRLASRLSPQPAPLLTLEEGQAAGGAEDAALAPAAVGPENLAYVIFTSGSTGSPKGVMVTHRSLVAATAARFAAYREPVAAFLLTSSFAFDSSVAGLFWTLCQGGALHLPDDGFQLEPERLAAAVRRDGISHLLCLPALLDLLLRYGEAASLAGLRGVIVAGETCPCELVRRHLARLPRVPLHNEYGPTEATVWSTFHRCTEADTAGTVPIGRAVAGSRVFLLDRALQLVAEGAPGELCIAGPGLARGYLGEPQATAASFLPDPAGGPGERCYRTGDLARWRADGCLEFLGRRDRQVKVRGFRVEPAEIEAVLAMHRGVLAAAVAAFDDALGERRLVAYYEAASAAPPDDELRAHLRRNLPEPMVPALLIAVARLPRTATGKLDRGALPPPELTRARGGGRFVAPRSREEERLAAIWAEVLGVAVVGVEDRFFDLGGDSISAVRVRVKAQQAGFSFTVQQLLAQPTVAALAGLGGGAPLAAAETAAVAPFGLLAAADLLALAGDVEDAYPLASLQLGMLLHGELGGEDAVFHDVVAVRATAPWDRAALAGALGRLAGAHPVLRTSFQLTAFSEPIQIVHRTAELPLAVVDLSRVPVPGQELALAAWLAAETRRPLAWDRAPLLRIAVHLLGGGRLHFGVTHHHAILDGWSSATLLGELFESYLAGVAGVAGVADVSGVAGVAGEAGRLPAVRATPAAGLRELVALERQAIGSEETRRFWADRLAGVELEPFPRWGVRAARSGPAGAAAASRQSVPVDAGLSDRLHQLAGALGVPIKSVLLAAHLSSMATASGRDEVVTALMTHGRPEAAGGDRALGVFLNAVPLRLRLGGGSWSELVRRSFAAEQEVHPHRRYPFARLQQAHGRQRLLETAFNFVHFHVLADLPTLPGVELRAARGHERTNFPLAAHASLGIADSRIGIVLLADPSEIRRAQLRALAGIYARTLAAMVDDPRASRDSVALLSPAEVHQLVVEWNDTSAEPPGGSALAHALVAAQAGRHPDRPAVVQGDRVLLYGELQRRSRSLARELVERGAGAGVCIGILLPPSPELLIALLAVLEAGSAFVPLDPAGPPARLAFQLADAGVRLVLGSRRLAAALPATAASCLAAELWPAAAPAGAAAGRAVPESPAYVLYTSGSTGTPKGVTVSHANLAAATAARLAAYPRPVERWLQLMSFTFDGALTPIFGTLATGGALHLPAPGAEREPALVAQRIGVLGITHLLCLPTWYEQILAVAAAGELATLAVCLVAGEPCPPGLPARHRAVLPDCELVNEYGPTEATIWCSRQPLRAAPPEEEAVVPIGRPIAGARLLVLDERLHPAPVGAPGEIWIGGAGVAIGYLNQPGLTAERFRPDPFAAGERLLRSGDLGRRRPDGAIEYLGRRDHQVKVRGFRIELGDVESALAEHPGVERAVVMAHEPAGAPLDRRLVAYFVARRLPAPAAAELREFLQLRLPAYMLPTSFVGLAEIPTTAAGKVDRRALPSLAGGAETAARAGVAAPPRDPIESQLLQIWEEVLEIRPIGVRDDFFEIGGHSLLGVSLVSRIHSRFGVALPITALFKAPTIERLAAMLRQPAAAPPPAPLRVVPLQPAGSRPPLFCIHPSSGSIVCYLELARRLGPDQPVYGLESPALHAPHPAPAASLDALAATYVEAIRGARAQGPYLLAGWSAGGVIAFAIAVQLAAAGERVAELILLDSRVPEPAAPDLDQTAIAARFGLELVGGRLPGPRPADDELRQLDGGELVRRILAAARATGVLAADAGEEEVQRRLDAFGDTMRMVAGYVPRPYAGHLTLIRAQGSGVDGGGDPTLGWEAVAPRRVEVVPVPWDHDSLLQDGGLDRVALEVRRCLERCGAGGGEG